MVKEIERENGGRRRGNPSHGGGLGLPHSLVLDSVGGVASW